MSILMELDSDRGGNNNIKAEFGSSSFSSSSYSIGVNSDDEGGDNEAESPYKGPLDMMESLEEVLPIRRGISKFYKGKSKSFRSLKEAESSPMKDLGTPDNLYRRRRRNLLSHRICSRGGISKKPVKTALTVVSSSGDDSSKASPLSKRNLPPRQSKESFGNCVPVVVSPRYFHSPTNRNIHNNIIC
ncbi:hypothetical protein Bca4012_037082 [Brassica carinata]|uniref:Uncharacterized protein n=1 Tax=Brassica carinata TaxID=52824 RepID=A0A8X8BB13_BRACI|nr:hypothetical protein Bca52824_010770 [Brassica carinata]